ncbi:MAG: signal peptide peptidase SppA [Bacteroidales bacterium]|nr:signal peptide peptidase SppA [Bacteroidales bacterium]MBQ1719046.1 signal peptide peptidase SppA [Bacteroidales bacterium]MBR3798038.1 signal peptide peptidase SppA [Bacteroidales bacterium]
MNKFWKVMLAVVVGVIIVHILYGVIFLLICLSAAGSSSSDVTVKDNSVLKISLTADMPDKVTDGMSFDYMSMTPVKQIGLNDALKSIEKAKTDDRIKGIYLDMDGASAGTATIEELRNKLIEFKESGKFIISYATAYSQFGYYLASVADEVYVNPQGGMSWQGMCSQIMFYKNVLEKLGVEMQVFRHGQFKSAVEPYICDKMSPANRKQYSVLLNSIWGKVCRGISEARGISVEDLNMYADSLSLRKAQDAVTLKFADAVKYYDEVIDELKAKSGFDGKDKDMFIDLEKYAKASVPNVKENKSKNEVAVLFAEGEIVDGNGGKGQMGGDKIAEELRKIRENDDVKAVVLRVNSPGGSGLASEVMWREIQKVKQAGKPVVVSMGNLAASGGYYISCSADYIYAQPTTLTGSIGVFGMFPNLQGLVTDKIGLTIDTVCTNAHADFGSTMRPVTEMEYNYVQQSIEDFYDTFLTRVFDGRKGKGAEGHVLSEKALVDSIGQGRVWAGADAIEIGLVDELGSLNDAVKKAVELANIPDYKIVEYPAKKEWFEELAEQFDISARIMKSELGENYIYYQNAKRIAETSGIQARMEHDIVIK